MNALVRTVVGECWLDVAGIDFVVHRAAVPGHPHGRRRRMVAAHLEWDGIRQRDGSGVVACHCRLVDGLIVEDWEAFFPSE